MKATLLYTTKGIHGNKAQAGKGALNLMNVKFPLLSHHESQLNINPVDLVARPCTLSLSHLETQLCVTPVHVD